MRRNATILLVVFFSLFGLLGTPHVIAAQTASGCTGAAIWWGETYPRLVLAEVYLDGFIAIRVEAPNGSAGAAYFQQMGDTLEEDAALQRTMTPPPVAASLSRELIDVYDKVGNAALFFAAHLAGSLNPMADQAVVANLTGAQGAAFSARRAIDEDAKSFLATCDPAVVFVLDQHRQLAAVYPGDTGMPATLLVCGHFRSQPAAQTFYLAAGPGDPYRLDADGNGAACDEPGVRFLGGG